MYVMFCGLKVCKIVVQEYAVCVISALSRPGEPV